MRETAAKTGNVTGEPPPATGTPVWWLLGVLGLSVGFPFFVVSTTSPLLQRWFANSGHPSAHDPYFLYRASNLGSMLALLGYPVLLEPAADLTGQANHLGVTIGADIIKQKLPETNSGYKALAFGKTHKKVYSELTPGDHPIEMTRYQVANCFMGRSGLINSGGASGENDFAEAARTAVINKRAGGMGLISGRKAFQRPMKEGIQILNLIQDVYLTKEITVA